MAARLYIALLMATRTRKEKSERVDSPGDARALVRAVMDAPRHHTRPSRAHRLVTPALRAQQVAMSEKLLWRAQRACLLWPGMPSALFS